MRVSRFLLSFAVVIVSVGLPIAAQQTATTDIPVAQLPTNRDPQAVTVLQDAYSALGGGVQPILASFSASGKYTDFLGTSPSSYSIRMMTLGVDKVRWETDLPSGTVVSIIRGLRGWTLDADGKTALSVSQVTGQGAENLPILQLAKSITSPKVLVSLVGVEAVDKTNAYHVTLTESRTPDAPAASDSETILRTVKQMDLYIDQNTHLPIRLRYYEHLGDWRRSVPIDLVFSDFRPVSGLLFPFNLTRYRNAQLMSQTQFETAALSQALTDDLFWVDLP